jgi:glycerol-1-phosphate dehydrogenase [NAD(P)+]
MEVQLCNQAGHARPEEGSEHYFAYCVENLMGHGLPHGDLVGPGIMITARLQGQETGRLERALKACHIPLDNIPEAVIQQTLKELPAYVRKHGLAYGIVHELREEDVL